MLQTKHRRSLDKAAAGAGPVQEMIRNIKEKKNTFWTIEHEARMLSLFHRVALEVPAYKDFLKKHGIDPKTIKTFKDFQKLPIVNKSNYLRQYPLKDLSWAGTLKKSLVFTSTSGSTGEPFYFCRGSEIDWQSSVVHELFYKTNSNVHEPALVIVGFGMGVWIGGIITYQAFEMTGQRGHPISLLTPGINKEEIFKALRILAPQYKQIILAGYAPFIKDILDEAPKRGIKLKDHHIRLLFAAEAFTEKFRDALCKEVHIKNPMLDTMNVYGSADIGTMAFETPLSILIRKLAMKNPKLFEDVFSPIQKTPTLAQYIPSFINFEEVNGDIVLTGSSSLPLVRYSIGDHGGVYTFAEMHEKLIRHGINLHKEAAKAGIAAHLYQLPFVYVYERNDFSTTLYGLQVYPETIKEVLLEKPFDKLLTGKLTLITRFDNAQDQYLEINLELQKNQTISEMAKKQLASLIVKNLRAKNSEYNELSKYLKGRAVPKLVFWPAEDPTYFKPGVKQVWVKKNN